MLSGRLVGLGGFPLTVSQGAFQTSFDFANGVSAQDVDEPSDIAAGDLLMVYVSSYGTTTLNADTYGNYTTSFGSTGDRYRFWYKTASATASENKFGLPAWGIEEIAGVRCWCMLCIKGGSPQIQIAFNGNDTTTSGDFSIPARTLGTETVDTIQLMAWSCKWEVGGSVLSTDTPYGHDYTFDDSHPNDDFTGVGKAAYGYLDPNPHYFDAGLFYTKNPGTLTTTTQIDPFTSWKPDGGSVVATYTSGWNTLYDDA